MGNSPDRRGRDAIAGSPISALGRKVRARVWAPVYMAQAKPVMSELIDAGGLPAVNRWIRARVRRGQSSEAKLRRTLFEVLERRDPHAAAAEGERVLALDSADHATAHRLGAIYGRIGNPERAAQLLVVAMTCWVGSPASIRLSDPAVVEEISRRLSEGTASVESWGRAAVEAGQLTELQMNQLLFGIVGTTSPKESVRFGRRAFELAPEAKLGRELAGRYQRLGALRECLEVRDRLIDDAGDERFERTSASLRGQLKLLEHGHHPHRGRPAEHAAEARKILYLLHNSLPYSSGGYAVRSHGLARAMRSQGFDMELVTRDGFPVDTMEPGSPAPPEVETVDRITYRRLLSSAGWGAEPLPDYLDAYAASAESLAREARPALVHAASNYMNGVVANHVATTLGIPSLYEVRGLWELTRGSRDPEWVGSEQEASYVRMETQAALEASAVIALTGALRDEMTERGVPAEKITVVPNAVDPARFVPRERDNDLARGLGVEGKTVIGYVGSVVDYEGLDLLVDAVEILETRAVSGFAVLVVGDGAVLEDMRGAVEHRRLTDRVKFTGRVPHEDVERYYGLIDIVPYPRKPLPVCEKVSPIKPFEAMAMEKAVVASDVEALREIVEDGGTGLLHRKGDAADLAAALERLLGSADLRLGLGERARRWVVDERSWSVVSARVAELYEELTR